MLNRRVNKGLVILLCLIHEQLDIVSDNGP